MSEPAILHWDRVIHKNVRSEDNMDVGTIISEAGDNVTIMQGPGREYVVRKEHFTGFDGAEVRLDMTYTHLLNYKVK